ncbi:hypothetical protein P4J00_23760 [Bacillus cereus]|nr:hypothetical protein [Bacillus cereus]
MKLKKTLVTALSVSVLGFGFSGSASAAEVPSSNNENNVPMSELASVASTTDTVATWGYWGKRTIEAEATLELDSGINFGYGFAYGIDGYQDAGSKGKPQIEYQLFEDKGNGNTGSLAWTSGIKPENGYVSASIPKSKIDPNKKYKLIAKSHSKFSVELSGNAYTSK